VLKLSRVGHSRSRVESTCVKGQVESSQDKGPTDYVWTKDRIDLMCVKVWVELAHV